MAAFEKVFNQEGTFQAWYAASDWLKESGYSFGSMCGSFPIGVMRGDYAIAKWKNLTPRERNQLDGTVTGNFHEGPVTVRLKHAPKVVISDPVAASQVTT